MNEVQQFCKTHEACREGAEWASQYQTLADVWANCQRGDWMIWMLDKSGEHKQMIVRLACACAEHVLEIYETRYPKDDRPRKTIAAALAWSENPTDDNRRSAAGAADAAAGAAWADARAAGAADVAAWAADAAAALADGADDARSNERAWQAAKIREIYGEWK